MKDYEALSKKHFDGQAAEYDQRDTYYYSQNGKISCRDIAEQIRAFPYESLLDVGCGTGFLIDLLTRQKAARYFGLDLSDEMIRVAQEKAIPGASFTVGSADHLPYPDESFDIVTCSQSFHHYPYPEKAMLEAIDNLSIKPEHLLIDAVKLDTTIPQTSIIKGDAKSLSIASASIIAKVTRDRMLVELDKLHPEYDFKHNKGYGTKKHIEALYKYGALSEHRKSFEPVKSIIKK